MSFHKLDKARDKNFWSVRVSGDIRLIVHKSAASLLLCYVDHHDKAYAWAERRKLETHPKTGAAQLVEIRETVQEIIVPNYVEVEAPRPARVQKPLFDRYSDDELLGYGVPDEWLADVRAATEDTIFALTDHLPAEASEALLELATGGKPRVPQPVATEVSPFEHPDAQRRFRVMTNVEELAQALDYPWDKWTVFLHPEQRQWVERDYNGPAHVSGSAGTGKTIVALHRAAYLARTNPDSRVLLATFSDTLANALQTRLNRLVSSEPRIAERIEVYSLDAIGMRLYKTHGGKAKLVPREELVESMRQASAAVEGHKFSLHFLLTEWEQIVDAWQLENWEAYRDVARLGRKTRLPESQRAILWNIFEQVRTILQERNKVTLSKVFTSLAASLVQGRLSPFDFAVIDEAQDISVSQLRFLAAMSGDRAKAAVKKAGLPFKILDEHVATTTGHASQSTMHLAKGLEFRAVAVMACDDEVIPLQECIETVGDDADLEEVYNTERHLLYVACTRARDHLLVTSVEPASEFLDDLRM